MECQHSEQPPSSDEAHFEEQEEMEEEDIDESQQSMSRAQDDIFSKFLNMTKQFTELVEDTRKQQLMLRNLKSSGKTLPVDCEVTIDRSQAAPFTPPRRAPVSVYPTQMAYDYDFERDSLSSQSTRQRAQLQEKMKVVAVKLKKDYTPAQFNEWLQAYAKAEMAKAGPCEDLHCKGEHIGGFPRAHVSVKFYTCMLIHGLTRLLLSWQHYNTMSDRVNGFKRIQYNCPFRYKCNCYVAISVKEYGDKRVISQAGEHKLDSHSASLGILTVKQRGAVQQATRAAPLAVGTQIHAALQNFSPGRQVPFDQRSRKAVDRLVRRTRKEVMTKRVGGIELDGSEGSMNELAESLSLMNLLKRHNDPNDAFHMDEHQPVCIGHQFGNGVVFMCLSTCHFLNNMARMTNTGNQKQGHIDGAFNWCRKDFALIGFGVNRMGAHFNPVSMSIASSESKEAIKATYKATCAALYSLYNTARLCDDESCGFCTQVREQVSGPEGRLWREQLLSDETANLL